MSEPCTADGELTVEMVGCQHVAQGGKVSVECPRAIQPTAAASSACQYNMYNCHACELGFW